MSFDRTQRGSLRRHGRRLARVVVGLTVLGALAAPASAARLGPQFEISTAAGELDADSSSVARRETTGGYLVVWRQGAIMGRRYNARGHARGAPFVVSTDPGGDPDVAYNSRRDEYLVAWSTPSGGSRSERTIAARRVAGSGRLRGEPLVVWASGQSPEPDPLSHRDPALAYNPERDEYLVTWDAVPYDNYPTVAVLGRRIAGDGTPVDPDAVQTGLASEHYAASDVAYDAARRAYLVVATDYCGGCGGQRVLFGRLLSEAGAPLGERVEINEHPPPTEPGERPFTSSADAAAVTYNAVDEELFVVWGDGTAYSGDPDQRDREVDIRGQRLEGAEKLGGNIVISRKRNLVGEIRNGGPAIAASPSSGVYTAVWSDGFEIYGKRFAPEESPEDMDDRRLSRMGPDGDAAFAAAEPAVSAGDGCALVTWQGDDAVDDLFGVFGRRLGSCRPRWR